VGAGDTGRGSEMLLCFSVLGSSEQEGVGTSGGLENQLVEGKNFTSCFKDSSSGGLGESESGNGDLGEV
jgi:hypothetical protein